MSRRGGSNNSAPNSTVLYVGLIPFEWDENNVRSVVCWSGSVMDVRMGYDYAGKNKGYCFVEYRTPEDAARGVRLLGQVQVTSGSNRKRLRAELSKEGLKSGGPAGLKLVIQPNTAYMPSNVQLPPEMMSNIGMGQGPPMPNMPNMPMPNMPMQNMPNLPMNPRMNNMNNMNNMNQNPMGQMGQGPMGPGPANGNQGVGSRNLPQPPTLPFTTPDKISENLSQIPPAQLIELISNLKSVLSGPNANRAPDVFQLSPHLATSAAQALLLMGFIDNEVIKDAMSAPQLETTPQMGHQNMNYNQQNMPLPNTNATPPPGSKWPFLPVSTQQKLAVMAPDQADLIAQVLTIPQEQIPSLEPDKQAMVSQLRAQYL